MKYKKVIFPGFCILYKDCNNKFFIFKILYYYLSNKFFQSGECAYLCGENIILDILNK